VGTRFIRFIRFVASLFVQPDTTNRRSSLTMSDSDDPEAWRTQHSWDDLVPIEQNDGPNPVCAIAYTPQCTRPRARSPDSLARSVADSLLHVR